MMKKERFQKILFFIGLLGCLFSTQVGAQSSSVDCSPKNNVQEVGPSSIHYLTIGSGRPVILLHGLFAQKEQWVDFGCQLAKRGYMIFAPDLPGYGQSIGFPIESYQLAEEVELIHRLVQKLKLPSFHIAGNSMGGAIAAMYSYSYPEEIQSIAFIGAPMGIIGWSPQIKSAIYAGVNPFIPITIDQFDLEMRLLFANPPSIDNSLKESAVSEYIKNNRHYQQVWDIVNLDIAILDVAKKSKKSTFIAWGKQDGVFNISGKVLLDAKFPKHVSYELRDVAHLAMLDKPKEIADLYIKFLKKQQ